MQITGKGAAAFATITILAAATGGSVLAATATASKAAQIAFGVLGLTAGGASIGAISAYFSTAGTTAKEYFESFANHAGIGIAGMYQFASQVLLQVAIESVGVAIRRAIAGPDLVIEHR